jgi:hypothetical protein
LKNLSANYLRRWVQPTSKSSRPVRQPWNWRGRRKFGQRLVMNAVSQPAGD